MQRNMFITRHMYYLESFLIAFKQGVIVRSNPLIAEQLCMVRDCFVPYSNDGGVKIASYHKIALLNHPP